MDQTRLLRTTLALSVVQEAVQAELKLTVQMRGNYQKEHVAHVFC